TRGRVLPGAGADKSLAVVWTQVGVRYQVTLPNKTAPTNPASPELNVSTSVVCLLITSWAESTSSSIDTSTPRPLAVGSAATETALKIFSGPSALIAVEGRIEPVKTTGLSLFTTRLRK